MYQDQYKIFDSDDICPLVVKAKYIDGKYVPFVTIKYKYLPEQGIYMNRGYIDCLCYDNTFIHKLYRYQDHPVCTVVEFEPCSDFLNNVDNWIIFLNNALVFTK